MGFSPAEKASVLRAIANIGNLEQRISDLEDVTGLTEKKAADEEEAAKASEQKVKDDEAKAQKDREDRIAAELVKKAKEAKQFREVAKKRREAAEKEKDPNKKKDLLQLAENASAQADQIETDLAAQGYIDKSPKEDEDQEKDETEKLGSDDGSSQN